MFFESRLSGVHAAVACFLAAATLSGAACGQTLMSPARLAQAVAIANNSPHSYVVIGFMGGIIRHDDPIRSEYKVAEDLRRDYSSALYVETFENRRRGEAHKALLRLLDVNHDGVLSEEEKRNARIILYDHSWGGAAVVALACELQKEGIPVLLTVQVDSVGSRDGLIPSNVARAANFYQPRGPIHGRAAIRAADPARTEILGNDRMDYKRRSVDCREFPWYERVFVKTHTEIACDPSVRAQAEALIREELPRPLPK